MLDSLAIALRGVGYDSRVMALQGFYPVDAVDVPVVNSGGYADYGRRRTKEDVRRDRERFGIPQEASRVIEAVAARQALQTKDKRLDEQQRLDELVGELELAGLEYEGRYLTLLNDSRERLITLEIASRMRSIQDENMILLLLAASL